MSNGDRLFGLFGLEPRNTTHCVLRQVWLASLSSSRNRENKVHPDSCGQRCSATGGLLPLRRAVVPIGVVGKVLPDDGHDQENCPIWASLPPIPQATLNYTALMCNQRVILPSFRSNIVSILISAGRKGDTWTRRAPIKAPLPELSPERNLPERDELDPKGKRCNSVTYY